jgi:hypothetical protein
MQMLMLEDETAQSRGLEPELERPALLGLTWEQQMLRVLAILAQVAQPAPWPCRPRRYPWCRKEMWKAIAIEDGEMGRRPVVKVKEMFFDELVPTRFNPERDN